MRTPLALRHLARATLAAPGLITLGVGLRIALLALGWPHTNSDEGTYGMMAIHIAYYGEHPVFMDGQHYMGAIEAYVAAAVFRLFGISLFSLRIGLVVLYGIFLYVMYRLSYMLYSRKTALFTLVLLSLGSSYVIYRQVQAVGGWNETLCFGACLYSIACWLALSKTTHAPLRWAAYASWGVFAGLCLWSDVVIAPFMLAAGILLWRFSWREIRTPIVLGLLLGGLLLGSLPMVLYNVHTPWQQDSLVAAFYQTRGTTASGSLVARVAHGVPGVLLVGLPAITGDNSVCTGAQGMFRGGGGPAAQRCTLGQGLWSLGWLILWSTSVALNMRDLRRLRALLRVRQHGAGPNSREPLTTQGRQTLVRAWARLGLLGAAALSLLLFSSSAAAVASPYLSSRYILFIWLATPALAAPLLQNIGPVVATAARHTRALAPILRVSQRLARAVIVLLFVWGTVATLQEVPATQRLTAQQQAFIAHLRRIGAVHIYSDYWTCERVMFQSRGAITCYTVNDALGQGYERYLPNKTIVTSDPRSSWVFPVGQALASASIVAHSARPYHQYTFDGYVIYQPAG